ncbi:hypothetical protein PHET_07873 [Paragonimus heterotremus]|uniref:Uncharacterized protein n=1 Tax=Paragonimus heterotremus TaxID=100268 RepID=A0A8J4WFE9_9TREM|nr:hypothetical protein PHET_07873 [Paragonimus heterotremus]
MFAHPTWSPTIEERWRSNYHYSIIRAFRRRTFTDDWLHISPDRTCRISGSGQQASPENVESYIKIPHIYAKWSWNIEFHHKKNSTIVANYSFTPTVESQIEIVDDADENSNKSFWLVVRPDLSYSSLSHFVLRILVYRDEDYFAWKNMSLAYSFKAPGTAVNPVDNYPLDMQTAQSNPNQKFLTRVDEIYECVSNIPVPLGENVTIFFKQMTLQAFNAAPVNTSNRLREICPRDFKTNIPITALTGASLLVLVATATGAFAINVFLTNRKRKEH